MSRTKSFVSGFASSTAQKILTKLIGLIITPIVLTYLDKTEYGIWVIIGSLLGYMGLMNFGVTGATSVITSKSNTKENEHRINIIINNAFVLQSIIGLFIIVLGIIVSFYFPNIFNIGEYSKEDAWLVFVMAIIGYGISFPNKSLKGLIRARQMISLSVWIQFVLFILTTILNLYLLHLGFGLLALPIGTIVIQLLSYPIWIFFAKKSYPKLRFDFSVITIENMKEILGVSLYWFVGMIAAVVIYSTDTILIGIFMSTTMVTMYALTFRLSEVVREFIYSISFTFMPALGQIMGEGDIGKARDIYILSQSFILSLAVIGAVFIYLFNGYFVRFWVGDEYFVGDILSLIFAGMLFIAVVFHSSSLILGADLKLKSITTIRITEAVINIGLSIWWVQLYGLIGVAFATLIAGFLTSFWAIPYITMKNLGISLGLWVEKIVLKLLGVLVVSVVLVYIVEQLSKFGTVGIVASFLLYLVVSILTIWYIVMDNDMKKIIYRKLKYVKG